MKEDGAVKWDSGGKGKEELDWRHIYKINRLKEEPEGAGRSSRMNGVPCWGSWEDRVLREDLQGESQGSGMEMMSLW